jgi:hypothetical protein
MDIYFINVCYRCVADSSERGGRGFPKHGKGVVLFGGHLHMGGMGTAGRKLESAKKGRRTVIDHRRRDGRRDVQ